MLGLDPHGAVAVLRSHFGSLGGDFIMDNVACQGHEAGLDLCHHTEDHNCGETEAAGVMCGGSGGRDTQVSLAGGPNSHSGNVLYNNKPIWYYIDHLMNTMRHSWHVSDDGWNSEDARVVCRMLGLAGATATHNAYFGTQGSDFIMDDVDCRGDEEDLWDCVFLANHNCASSEAAGVICSQEPDEDESSITSSHNSGGESFEERSFLFY